MAAACFLVVYDENRLSAIRVSQALAQISESQWGCAFGPVLERDCMVGDVALELRLPCADVVEGLGPFEAIAVAQLPI